MSNSSITAVERTLEIIEILHENGGSQVTILAEKTGIPTSTVHDHLSTLCNHGLVINRNGRYLVSTRFLEIGDQARQQMRLYQSAKPELMSLADQTGEHASLQIEENGIGVVLYDVRGEQAIQFDSYPGMRTKLHLSAAGKAILSCFTEAEIQDVIEKEGLPARTDSTITDSDELLAKLKAIRSQGFALDRQEGIDGMRGVGVPLTDRNQDIIGGISIYGPRSRIDDDTFESVYPDLLLESANVIEINYGFQRGV